MTREVIILIAAYVLTLLAMERWVPREKARDAWTIFLFMQLITWLLGITSVEFGWLEYPVREFPYATRQSLAFEYFIYPAVCVLHNLYYPEQKSWLSKFGYYLLYVGALTLFEVLLERYTDLIEYTGWSWYWTLLTLPVTLYLSWVYYKWYRKGLVQEDAK